MLLFINNLICPVLGSDNIEEESKWQEHLQQYLDNRIKLKIWFNQV